MIGPFVRRALLSPCICLLLALFGSVAAKAQVSEVETLGTLEAFFSALSVENYGNGDLETTITDDFIIFEMGQRFTLKEFKEFLTSANYANWISTSWSISNYTITSSNDSAHIFYQNDGVFVFPSDDMPKKSTQQKNMWLESALIVRENGVLKLRFLQSENVSRVDSILNDLD
jgi:hypothetical protein